MLFQASAPVLFAMFQGYDKSWGTSRAHEILVHIINLFTVHMITSNTKITKLLGENFNFNEKLIISKNYFLSIVIS